MKYKNKTMTCCMCQTNFDFTAGEQEFFYHKGLTNEPKRCANCRVLARLSRKGKDTSSTTSLNCDKCSTFVIVPFKPNGTKPVYCMSCLHTADTDREEEILVAV